MILRKKRKSGESGMSMIELLIAMTVLAVGIAGILGLILMAILTDNRNARDTTATMVAQTVLERVEAVPANSTAIITIPDCSGANMSVGMGNVGVGSVGAPLTASGQIDWTAATVANYSGTYNACGPGGAWYPYSVRWNVQTLYAGPAGPYVKIITVSARPAGATQVGAAGNTSWALPVTLRTVVGM
jgi:prepilin-type N-terminal cleavage/methylation domain-containing protein